MPNKLGNGVLLPAFGWKLVGDMTENISTRAEKRWNQWAINRPLSADLSLVVFSGLIVWGIVAVVCHFVGVPGEIAFGVAVLWTAWGFFDTFRQRRLDYSGYLIEELETSLKNHVTKELRDMSEHVRELKQQIERIERNIHESEPPNYSAPRREITEPVRAWQSSFGIEDQHGGDIKVWIEDAIKDIDATAPNHVGMVIKAVRGRLNRAGRSFDEKALSDLVRFRLQIKQ
jgi:hypothetical protein